MKADGTVDDGQHAALQGFSGGLVRVAQRKLGEFVWLQRTGRDGSHLDELASLAGQRAERRAD